MRPLDAFLSLTFVAAIVAAGWTARAIASLSLLDALFGLLITACLTWASTQIADVSVVDSGGPA